MQLIQRTKLITTFNTPQMFSFVITKTPSINPSPAKTSEIAIKDRIMVSNVKIEIGKKIELLPNEKYNMFKILEAQK